MTRIVWRGAPVTIETAFVGTQDPQAPLMVFLHEGLGSLAMWKDFPDRLCRALGWRALVYSRPGYGRSTPRPSGQAWEPDFMHRQALEVLPALLQALGIDAQRERPWLYGHSDGGSIALLYAAHRPDAVAGLVVAAPHILVEDIGIESIARARQAYLEGELRQRLARYHDDVDSAFWGWNDIWLAPAFRSWDISAEIASIRCPVLAAQGLGDEYGSLEQIRGIARRLPQAQLLELPYCGHSPHRDQPDALVAGVQGFIARHHAPAAGTP